MRTRDDEYDRPPMPFVPRGPIRHGIRWTTVTWAALSALWHYSQALLTAHSALGVAVRVIVGTVCLFAAYGIATRRYRPLEER